MKTDSRVERTHGKVAAGRPSEVADCRTGQARLQLANPVRRQTVEWGRPGFR